MHPGLTILTETWANATSGPLDFTVNSGPVAGANAQIGTSAHTHSLNSLQGWNGVAIGSGAIAPSNGIAIGSGATASANGCIAIGSGAVAYGSHTHTLAGIFPMIEALPSGASVRFKIDNKDYTGEILSQMEDGPAEPIYVIQPDNELPKTGSKPIALTHTRLTRITFLQRFTEAVWADDQ